MEPFSNFPPLRGLLLTFLALAFDRSPKRSGVRGLGHFPLIALGKDSSTPSPFFWDYFSGGHGTPTGGPEALAQLSL